MPFACLCVTIKAHIGYGLHMGLEEIRLDDIEHLLHLAEDQNAVL